MTAPPSLLLATTNPDKRARLRWIVDGLGFSLDPRPPAGETPQEHEDSHLGNAIFKATWWSQRTRALVLASDGGVDIPELGSGWASTLTRRASGAATSAGRIRDLLDRMRGFRGDERSANWIEAVALAEGGQLLGAWSERGPRLLVAESPAGNRSDAGFWMDTVLAEPLTGRVLAELSVPELRRVDRPWRILRVCVRRRLATWKADRARVLG